MRISTSTSFPDQSGPAGYHVPGLSAGGNLARRAIDYIYPYLKEATRTARVRLRFANPKLKLKPEMFTQVKISSPVTRQAVVVPTEAVLDTGLKQHVFIALGGGKFEPREVKLGVYGDGNHVRKVLFGPSGGRRSGHFGAIPAGLRVPLPGGRPDDAGPGHPGGGERGGAPNLGNSGAAGGSPAARPQTLMSPA